MSNGFKARVLATTADVVVTTTTETVVATLSGISTRSPDERVALLGWLQITLGTLTTTVTLRIRRGTAITDTLVGEANAEAIFTAAGSTESHALATVDVPGSVAGQSYVLTVQQAGATANGTVLQSYLEAALGVE